MSPYTHVLEYDGGALIASLGGNVDMDEFAAPLRRFNGTSQFALTLWPLPQGMDYDEARRAGQDAREYLQAAGLPDRLTVEIRKPGGAPPVVPRGLTSRPTVVVTGGVVVVVVAEVEALVPARDAQLKALTAADELDASV